MPDARGAGRVRVGTSGWSYPKGAGTWDGVFYPPRLPDKDKLAFYAQDFDTVEIPFPERGEPELIRWDDRQAAQAEAEESQPVGEAAR